VKILFDTSVIVAASLSQHPSHTPCFAQLQQAKARQYQGYLSTHSLAEIYSVLTRMPSQPKLSPQNVQSLIDRNLQFLTPITLETADYQAAIAQMTALNLPGGGIYDALIARAAAKVTADRLMTLNPKHFTRLDPAIAQIVFVPS
jgi:predicted nucleic acid-binding protein